MTIKQDWENWKQARNSVKLIQREMEVFCKNVVKECSVDEYEKNRINTRTFSDIANYEYISNHYWNWLALKHRSTSCFYKASDPKYELAKCINVRLDGTVAYCCKKCLHHSTMDVLASLIRRAEQAKQDKSKAMHNLLCNVLFWKKSKELLSK